MQSLCQIQSHEGNQLSHICIYINCFNESRWLCQECIRNQYHDHIEGVQSFTYLRAEIDFMNDFKANIQPQIEARLYSEEGIQIKCKYIQNIKNDLTNDAIFKQVQIDDFNYKSSNIMLINSIQDLIECNQQEIGIIQNLKKTYKELTNNGLKSLNLEEINMLLNNQNSNFQGETLLFQKIAQLLGENAIYYFSKNEFRDHVSKLLINIYIKFIKLEDFIKYHLCINLNGYGIDDDFVFFLQNERYLARLNFCNCLEITDMKIKKDDIKKQITFKQTPLYMSFDSQWRHVIIFDINDMLYHYYFSRNVKYMRQIRKYQFMNYISKIFLMNHHKFMIIGKNQIEIRELINNSCVNKIILENNDSSKALLPRAYYGRIKSIIVITLDDDQNIFIYKDDQCQPFIKQNINTQSEIKIRQIALISDDLQLFSYDQYEIKLWQIDYQDQKLILINKIQINKQDKFWFSDNVSLIIQEQDCSIQILDKNFKIQEEIKLIRKHRCYNLQFSQQSILLMYGREDQLDQHKILRKTRTDYDKLQFY